MSRINPRKSDFLPAAGSVTFAWSLVGICPHLSPPNPLLTICTQILIFSQMTRMLDIIEDHLYMQNTPCVRLDGSMHRTDREHSIHAFTKHAPSSSSSSRAEGAAQATATASPQIFLLSTRAGGLGLNLQIADTLILFDSDYNPQADLQAIARAHRMNCLHSHNLLIFRLVTMSAENTFSIEEHIYKRAFRKYLASKEVLKHGVFDHQTNAATSSSACSSRAANSSAESAAAGALDLTDDSEDATLASNTCNLDKIDLASFAVESSSNLHSNDVMNMLCDRRSGNRKDTKTENIVHVCIDYETNETLQLMKLHYSPEEDLSDWQSALDVLESKLGTESPVDTTGTRQQRKRVVSPVSDDEDGEVFYIGSTLQDEEEYEEYELPASPSKKNKPKKPKEVKYDETDFCTLCGLAELSVLDLAHLRGQLNALPEGNPMLSDEEFGATLILCDGCDAAYHLACVGKPVPLPCLLCLC